METAARQISSGRSVSSFTRGLGIVTFFSIVRTTRACVHTQDVVGICSEENVSRTGPGLVGSGLYGGGAEWTADSHRTYAPTRRISLHGFLMHVKACDHMRFYGSTWRLGEGNWRGSETD